MNTPSPMARDNPNSRGNLLRGARNPGAPRRAPAKPQTVSRSASYTVRRLFEVMAERRITIAQVADHLDMSRVGIAQWKSGRTTPRIDMMELWAAYLGVRLEVSDASP